MDDSAKSSATDAAGKRKPDGATAPSPPRAVDYGHAEPSALGRWLWQTFRRENLLSGLRTLSWVAPLTILIWVYAEREQEFSQSDVVIPLEVKSADPTRVVTLRMPRDGNVQAVLAGPRAQVEKVIELIRPRESEAGVIIQVDRRFQPGTDHTLSTLNVLNDSPVFKSHGVSVRDAKPGNLSINVDEITEQEVEVRVPPSVTNLSAHAFEPHTVKVRGPRAVLENRNQVQPWAVYADLARRGELNTPGEHTINAVRVFVEPESSAITISPPVVKATIEVNQAEVRYQIPSMPVWFTVSPNLDLQRYKVELTSPVITDVWVVGPQAQIDMLRNERFLPKARFQVSRDDINLPQREAPLEFDLPQGVKLAPESGNRTVSFKVVERPATQ